MLAVLEEGGIRCTELDVRDGEEVAAERSASPVPPGTVTLPLRESGMCIVEGGPRISGKRVFSHFIVYEDDEHLEFLPERGFIRQAFVYGENWEVLLANLGLADRVAELLDGRVIPPRDVPRG
jgi:hypothetical protein